MRKTIYSKVIDWLVGNFDRYCQIKFATLDSVYHVTLPVYPVI